MAKNPHLNYKDERGGGDKPPKVTPWKSLSPNITGATKVPDRIFQADGQMHLDPVSSPTQSSPMNDSAATSSLDSRPAVTAPSSIQVASTPPDSMDFDPFPEVNPLNPSPSPADVGVDGLDPQQSAGLEAITRAFMNASGNSPPNGFYDSGSLESFSGDSRTGDTPRVGDSPAIAPDVSGDGPADPLNLRVETNAEYLGRTGQGRESNGNRPAEGDVEGSGGTLKELVDAVKDNGNTLKEILSTLREDKTTNTGDVFG